MSMSIESGTCLALGASNARAAMCADGDISRVISEGTPSDPAGFFNWLARRTLDAAYDGSSWVVAGFPGPVSADGVMIGPMANVPGLKEGSYDLRREMAAADSAAADLLASDEFTLVIVNDGDLSAHAAGAKVAELRHAKVAALIIGSGLGSGVVVRDEQRPSLFRADRSNPLELGHVMLSTNPADTYENRASGNGLRARFRRPAEEMKPAHPAWQIVGETAGLASMQLGLLMGVDLVVPTGGLGIGAQEKYGPHLDELIRRIHDEGIKTQRDAMPEVLWPDIEYAQTFEFFGAESIMRTVRADTPPPDLSLAPQH